MRCNEERKIINSNGFFLRIKNYFLYQVYTIKDVTSMHDLITTATSESTLG